mgnify:CR=1 FL=1
MITLGEHAGRATLDVERVAGASAVTSAYATSPVKLLVPRARGPSAWVCMTSFGGGLVGGDQTRLTARIGQAFHSFEIKVENGKEASQAFRDSGCEVASDYGVFFFVKAESTGGVLLEVCETKMPNDPYDRPGGWGPQVGTDRKSHV